MSDLNINDLVVVLDENNVVKYSKVIGFLHRIENIKTEFIRLFYDLKNNVSITLTPKHLIWTIGQHNYKPAELVNIGDLLQFYHVKSNTHQTVKIHRIERIVLNEGIYSPLTESGTLLVDNIKVSCYSIIRNHYVANFFYDLLNYLNKYLILINYQVCSMVVYDILNYFYVAKYLLFV